MAFTTGELAQMFGMSKRTMERRLEKLRKEKKFEKTSDGNLYNEEEAMQLAKTLGYSYTPKEQPRQITPTFRTNFGSATNTANL